MQCRKQCRSAHAFPSSWLPGHHSYTDTTTCMHLMGIIVPSVVFIVYSTQKACKRAVKLKYLGFFFLVVRENVYCSWHICSPLCCIHVCYVTWSWTFFWYDAFKMCAYCVFLPLSEVSAQITIVHYDNHVCFVEQVYVAPQICGTCHAFREPLLNVAVLLFCLILLFKCANKLHHVWNKVQALTQWVHEEHP